MAWRLAGAPIGALSLDGIGRFSSMRSMTRIVSILYGA
jgi:hypothetical protein